MAARAKAKSGSGKLTIRTLVSTEPGFARAFDALVRRGPGTRDDVAAAAEKIVDRVREGGDEELLACIRKFDGAKVDEVEVTAEEWDRAVAKVDPADRAALGKATMRVRDFHKKRIPSSW